MQFKHRSIFFQRKKKRKRKILFRNETLKPKAKFNRKPTVCLRIQDQQLS